jgi:hypothetical protein
LTKDEPRLKEFGWMVKAQAVYGGKMRNLPLLAIGIAMFVATSPARAQQIDPGFKGFWTLNVEKSDFGNLVESERDSALKPNTIPL